MVARESGLECPSLFGEASAYGGVFNHFKLSTSQVATNADDMYMCYGPVCRDGYGCCYNPLNDEIIFAVSSFADCESTSSKRFLRAIENALGTIGEICSKYHKKRSASFGNLVVLIVQLVMFFVTINCSFEINSNALLSASKFRMYFGNTTK